MARMRLYAPLVFLPHTHVENLPRGSVVIDVSSYADFPWRTFSPMWVHGGIPVPGRPGTLSDTVEGIWQGLKVIRGKTAPRYFRGPDQKRGGKPSGHQWGLKLLDIVKARFQIYKVAYEWVLEHRIDPGLIEQLIQPALGGTTQYVHDVEDNGNINNGVAPLAHASLLVQYVNRRCEERLTGH